MEQMDKGTTTQEPAVPQQEEVSGKKKEIRIKEKVFHFAKPKLRHRNTVLRILEAIGKSEGNMKGIAEVVQKKGWTPEQAMKIKEEDLTFEERIIMTNYSGIEKILKLRQADKDIPDKDKPKTVWDVAKIPDSELSAKEQDLKNKTFETFEIMNEVLVEVLYCTIQKTNAFEITGIESFDDMDYDDAVVLFRNGMEFIREAAINIKQVKEEGNKYRKN